ncbi:hypothetical protein GCM10023092_22950 [Rurimicrobium arvi]|uniref:Uncharacterized protein n=2 Tax=Rurimicrobium arvi TaxID=2049916 RepID=A0ABP8MYN3_9BACT
MLEPKAQDTAAFYTNQYFKKYPCLRGGDKFSYYYLPIVRGLVDTALLNPEHYSRFQYLDDQTKLNLAFSPLIIIGEVSNVLNEDTSAKAGQYFLATNVLIKIKEVIHSRYAVKPGDFVSAKTQLYGLHRSKITHKVTYDFIGDVKPYDAGKTYLFVLNKWDYMEMLYLKKIGISLKDADDSYCPTSFILSMGVHDISSAYESHKLSLKDIKGFLSHH